MFKVSIYKDVNEMQAKDAKETYDCGQNVKFAYEGFTDENMPLLITYSYDPRVANVDYKMIAAQARATQIVASADTARRKRQITETCRKHPLIVKSTEILFGIVSNDPSCEIVYPSEYDAGICGGTCDETLPGSHTNHAPFINILISSNSFSSRHPTYNFKPCCVPVKYRSLRVYTQSPDKSSTIVTVDNMIIDQCDCIDILE